MKRRNRRILWLHTHKQWRDFEVPMLNALGYEVWTAKKSDGTRSTSPDFSYDASVSIPAEVLERLNSVNFYTDPFSGAVIEDINLFFCAAFVPPYPTNAGPLLQNMLRHFSGIVVLRVAGREAPRTYGELLTDVLAQADLLRDRFWMASAFGCIPEVEGSVLRRRSVHLPIGLPPSEKSVSWRGGGGYVLFFCPEILSLPGYYGVIYQKLRQDWSDLPYKVAGVQPVPVVDSHVLGFLPKGKLDQIMIESEALFYPSQEPRHCHYYPFEAMWMGVPVIFMRGGILEGFGGTKQPGACSTVREAREKVKRLIAKDTTLLNSIQTEQRTVLAPMLFNNVLPFWQDRLPKILGAAP